MLWRCISGLRFAKRRRQLNTPLVPPLLTIPVIHSHETFSSKTHFDKTKLGLCTETIRGGREQIVTVIQCGV